MVGDPARIMENQKYDQVRRFRRIPSNITVHVFVGEEITPARGHDINEGGMALYAPLELAIGAEVGIQFQLPKSRKLLGVRGVIRNRNGFRYGVEFKDLTPTEVEEIRRVGQILLERQK